MFLNEEEARELTCILDSISEVYDGYAREAADSGDRAFAFDSEQSVKAIRRVVREIRNGEFDDCHRAFLYRELYSYARECTRLLRQPENVSEVLRDRKALAEYWCNRVAER